MQMESSMSIPASLETKSSTPVMLSKRFSINPIELMMSWRLSVIRTSGINYFFFYSFVKTTVLFCYFAHNLNFVVKFFLKIYLQSCQPIESRFNQLNDYIDIAIFTRLSLCK